MWFTMSKAQVIFCSQLLTSHQYGWDVAAGWKVVMQHCHSEQYLEGSTETPERLETSLQGVGVFLES